MVRIAPVRLSFNPKTLWFDAEDLELSDGDAVVVSTARGEEYGALSGEVFSMDYEDTKKLKSPLKPVLRLATPEDAAKDAELAELSRSALPVFKHMAEEHLPDMHPIAVEYLFSGDKAIFYFEAEDRVDFRDLVRQLASEFHVRIDMKQIGVRDGARLVGGLGHCGQELCCRRLGGEFNPVSIRMAKEQDLSLNPQKISGICGRLMCCLRYEYDAYKDFHSRAPKKNATIHTPDGDGKVVDLDVPRELIAIKVEDEKPVKVPLASMEAPTEGKRPDTVGEKAWEEANEPAVPASLDGLHLFGTSQLTGNDKLATPGQVRRVGGEESSTKQKSRRRRSRGGSSGERAAKQPAAQEHRKQRRRSTTVGEGEGAGQKKAQGAKAKGGSRPAAKKNGQSRQNGKKTVQVGRNSSALRAGRPEGAAEGAAKSAGQSKGQRRRRRSHKAEAPTSE